MIDLLITICAVGQSSAPRRNQRFDDSQDCLTFLERQVAGSVRLSISRPCLEDRRPIAPWRSL
jgi:hypothetical protein